VQLSRKKGWRKPAGAVVVARPSKWGNPVVVGAQHPVHHWEMSQGEAVALYRELITVLTPQQVLEKYGAATGPALVQLRAFVLEHAAELKGKPLCCWCGPKVECHADVLAELANA
jgi:hypothetical protein